MNNNIKFSYPSSEKVYLNGTIYPDLKVGMRRVHLAPTVSFVKGERREEPNAPVYLYDTSGAYSDPNIEIDLKQGLPKLRQPWIDARQTGETQLYFAKKGVPIDIHFQYTAQNPSLHRARVIADKMLENYENGDIDEVYIIYTNMKSSVVVEPQMIQLLPMKRTDFAGVPTDVFHEEIVMEPSPKAVLDRIIPNCVMGYIYGALVESFCSEQNSRMMAMDSATKSAKEMLDDLNIKYNRARQAAITQEITEIAGGARAQRDRS